MKSAPIGISGAKAHLGAKRKNSGIHRADHSIANKKRTNSAIEGTSSIREYDTPEGNDENDASQMQHASSESEDTYTPKRCIPAAPKLLHSQARGKDMIVQMNTTLTDMANRMEKWESKMKGIEKYFSASKSAGKEKKQISSFVRVSQLSNYIISYACITIATYIAIYLSYT